MRVRMNVLPKRASTLRLPEPLVSPAQPIPAEVLFILCGESAALGSTPGGVRGFKADLYELAFIEIRGKGTGAAQFPTESVSKQLAREQ